MILYIVFFFLLTVALLRIVPLFRIPNASPWLLPIGFSIKTAVGFFFLYIYSYHYGVGELTADASEFIIDSKTLNGVFYESPASYFRFLFGLNDQAEVFQYLSKTTQWDTESTNLLHDARNILRLHSVIQFVSFGETIIHVMVVAVISLLGLKFMIMALTPYVKVSATLMFFALLFMPNVLFWSSGILKEPLILFSLGFFLYTILGNFKPLKKVIYFILSIICLLGIKPYLLICIVLAVCAYFLFKSIKDVRWAWGILAVVIVTSLMSLLTSPMKPVVKKLSDQQFDFINIGKGGVFARADTCVYIIYGADMPYVIIDKKDSTVILTKEVVGDYIKPYEKRDKRRCIIQPNEKPWKMYYDGEFSGSYIEITPIEESANQLVKNIPQAIENVVVRPYPNDPPHSILKYVTIIDGWGLYAVFLVVVFFFRRKISRDELNLIVALVVFSLVLTLLIGWITPIIGAIIRYKVPIQLAVMLITLILLNSKKLKNG